MPAPWRKPQQRRSRRSSAPPPGRASRRISPPIRSGRFRRPKRKASASPCRYAGRSSKPMAAASGSTSTRPAPPFISPYLLPSRQRLRHRPMADPIHIALIDDDSAVLASLQLYFVRRNVKTSCFESAESLLTALERGAEPDCIVSDVRMPGMSGLDLVRRLNARWSISPVILITGLGDIDMAVSAIKLGAFDFIEKPFDEGRLLTSIRHAVAGRRQHANDAAESQRPRSRFERPSARQR